MKRIDKIFNVHVARSIGYEDHKPGDTAFITNGFDNNGVQGFVTPDDADRVFHFDAICVSAFCEATVHNHPFVGRGNGGSGIIVLEPQNEMSRQDLLKYSAYLNICTRWKFSYGRMVSKERISQLKIPEKVHGDVLYDTKDILPRPTLVQENKIPDIYLKPVKLTDIFTLHSGDYHNSGDLPDGDIPLISCGEYNNGAIKFVTVPQNRIYENTLTIAYNGKPLTAKYHPYKFAAKDDVAVCIPKKPLLSATFLFLQQMIENEKWRFSYGRKCFREKLSKISILAPLNEDGTLDEGIVKATVENTSHWDYLQKAYDKGVKLQGDIVT